MGTLGGLAFLAGYVAIAYGDDSVFELPLPAVWLATLSSFTLGAAVRPRVAIGPVVAVVLAAGAVFALCFLALAGPLAVAPKQAALGAGVVAGAFAAGSAAAAYAADADRWVLILAGGALAVWILLDRVIISGGLGLYDLRVYLASGAQYLAGQQPYLTEPLTALPASADATGFIYPPPMLPPFAGLSLLPFPVAAAAWLALLIGSAVLALRLLGMSGWWPVFFLAFPPLLKGLDSGNVATLLLLVLVLGPVAGALLPLGALFKVQAIIPALWLPRQHLWRDLSVGLAAVGLIVLVTLPLVGLSAWESWADGLAFRIESQQNVPILYGNSLAGVLPPLVFAAVSIGAVALVLVLSGRRGLAALGLAGIVASPTLWPHGFLATLPALLLLDRRLLWLGLGVGAGGVGLWLLPVLAGWALLRPAGPLRLDGRLHPLGRAGPWWPARPTSTWFNSVLCRLPLRMASRAKRS